MSVDASHVAAANEAKANPKAHHPKLVQARDVRAKVHGGGAIGRFNAWFAVHITAIVGTMWCAYAFTALSFYGLPAALSGGAGAFVQWASSQFIQLVLLPIIIVGQNVISAAQDARAEADHETLIALHTMNVQQLEILENQQKTIKLLEQKL